MVGTIAVVALVVFGVIHSIGWYKLLGLHPPAMPDVVMREEGHPFDRAGMAPQCVLATELPDAGRSLHKIGTLGSMSPGDASDPGRWYASVHSWGFGPSVFAGTGAGGSVAYLAMQKGNCYYLYREGV